MPELLIPLQAKQRELLSRYENGPATILGYGGSRGGAKSHGGRGIMAYRRWNHANTNGFIIRKTIDDLRDNHIMPMMREYPYMRDWYNKQEKIIQFPNGSYIRFISADTHDAIFKLYGKEAADIFLDQAEQFTQEQIEFLQTINRCTTNLNITPKTLLTFNPGNVGHKYLKRLFVLKSYEGNENPDEYDFLRAYGWDNVYWSIKVLKKLGLSITDYEALPDKDRFNIFIQSDYGSKLNRLPDAQRKAQLLGDFDVFEGQFFWMIRDNIHFIPPIRYDPSWGWNVRGGLDYGQRTVLEVAGRDYEGRVIFFAECYTDHATPAERATRISDMLLDKKLYNLQIVYDTNMDINLKEYTGYDKTPIQIFREVLESRMGDKKPQFHVVSKHTTDNRGYRAFANEAFIHGLDPGKDSKPIIRITHECKHLKDTIVDFIQDPNSVEGLDFDLNIGIDDPYDAAKMVYLEMRTPTRPPKPTANWIIKHMQKAKAADGWKTGMG